MMNTQKLSCTWPSLKAIIGLEVPLYWIHLNWKASNTMWPLSSRVGTVEPIPIYCCWQSFPMCYIFKRIYFLGMHGLKKFEWRANRQTRCVALWNKPSSSHSSLLENLDSAWGTQRLYPCREARSKEQKHQVEVWNSTKDVSTWESKIQRHVDN